MKKLGLVILALVLLCGLAFALSARKGRRHPAAQDETAFKQESSTAFISIEEQVEPEAFDPGNAEALLTFEEMDFGGYTWIVLAKHEGKALITTKDVVVNRRQYNWEYGLISWEKCTLRETLNGFFYNSFSSEDRSRIVQTSLTNGGDANTSDNIFLLSVEEAIKYFGENDRRIAHDNENKVNWWLRSPGGDRYKAAYVRGDGRVDTDGVLANQNSNMAVRPSLWLNLSDAILTETVTTEASATTTKMAIEYKTMQFGGYDWLVLDEQDGKALLITKDIIGQRPFNTERNKKTFWSSCTLRTYLNGEFYDSFSEADRNRIAITKLLDEWDEAKIFLLSIQEVVKYFGDSGDFKAGIRKGYDYWLESYVQEVNGELIYDQYNDNRLTAYNEEKSEWLLRTQNDRYHAAIVNRQGAIDVKGISAWGYCGVRPALWLTL
ncbi:MAG: DUF6273 domain-containing protein [Oscillospiraceae bacterium]|nr:DUF6273 domain-containing protein [Oscillospiraceae bacterium]